MAEFRANPRQLLELAGEALDEGDTVEAELLLFLAMERGATDKDVEALSAQQRRKLQRIFRRRAMEATKARR